MAKKTMEKIEILDKIDDLVRFQAYTVREACEKVGISVSTYYRWRREPLSVPASELLA